jgi:hypothetical protein
MTDLVAPGIPDNLDSIIPPERFDTNALRRECKKDHKVKYVSSPIAESSFLMFPSTVRSLNKSHEFL